MVNDAHTRTYMRDEIILSKDVQVRSWTDVDAKWLARGFKSIRQRDVVSEETVSWHLLAHDARQHHPGVNANAHLIRQ